MLYFNILVQTKRFRNSVLTNNLRVIRHAWHFWYASVEVRIERSVSCAAMFISFLALVISIWQGYEAKKHNRLSFTPYLQISPRLVGDISSGLYLENAGTGTAFFKSIVIIVNRNKFDLTKNQ